MKSEVLHKLINLILDFIIFIVFGIMTFNLGYYYGLKEGNINVSTGKPDYELVKHDDGSVSWEMIKKTENE